MSWQDDDHSRKFSAAPYPGGGREPRFDVPRPGERRRAEEEDETPSRRNPQESRDQGQRDAAQREASLREAAQREAAEREAAQREASLREAAQRESQQREAAARERESAWANVGGGAAGESAELRAELDKARAEIAELKDKALRATAEVENFRRRAEKEREDVAKYAISNFAREMLPVADNLRRALDSQPAASGEAAAALKNFVAGLELTERELIAAFERFGLTRIDPMGQPFDHNFHQAMFEVEDANHPPGTVVQVMQPGYMLKERLLRPALVGVSKAVANENRDGEADEVNSPA